MTISSRPPLGTTSKICQKSPPRTIIFPPKDLLGYLCIIQLHQITQGLINNFESSTMHHRCLMMLQVDSSCKLIEILNLEWVILLPRSNKMQFLMRQLQARFYLALIDKTKALSKQMFCWFHHCHTHRIVCSFCLSRHSK